MTVLTVTLGHDGLGEKAQHARFYIADVMATAGEVLATFLDGAGTCAADDGSTVTETCDAWVVNVPSETVADLRNLLSACAGRWGQDALGCIIHDDAFGPSYCEAPA